MDPWELIISPFLRGVDGSLTSSWEELPFQDDPFSLDAFEDHLDIEARRGLTESEAIQARRITTLDAPDAIDTGISEQQETAGLHRLAGFKLPRGTRGERIADTRALLKGVGPGESQGSGHILDLARTQLGTPYVFGASNPGTAFDCSGFAAWAYQRAFGISLPHQSTAQAKELDKVERDDLQPGDLVFFSYGRLGQGVIDHVEIYMGDGKMIGTANTTDDLDIDTVDWEHFVQGGRAPGVASNPEVARSRQTGNRGKPQATDVSTSGPVLAPLALSQGPAAFSAVIDAMFSGQDPVVTETPPKFRGGQAAVNRQLYKGFVDAGRPDLARMVGTKEFESWVRAESGYRPDVVSQHFEGHGVNYGLFQFWEGHDWTQEYVQNGTFTATPYEQAKLVARYFSHLTPAKIREYAEQIAAGDYHGWG
jgi:cell wall-associated NlpC family hydrolase